VEEVTIQKLVHGGQGLAELGDGRKVFVWNALPGERVRVRIIKKKHRYAEAIAEEVITASSERIAPREENYLATSPWQMMNFAAENTYKADIVRELFTHEKVQLPEFGGTVYREQEWHYRNKMEYSFWGDDLGLHLALYRRGSHGKQVVTGSELAMPALDEGTRAVLGELQGTDIRAGDLKTIIVRCNQKGIVVAALYTKMEKFPRIELPAGVKGLRVYYSDPCSPASLATRLLYEIGDAMLQDDIIDKTFTYDVESFFQVNIPVYEDVLRRIREHCKSDPVDMYAGVGSIGLSVARTEVTLVELDQATARMAQVNAAAATLNAEVVAVSTEKALEHIAPHRPIIFDPPRAGLHAKVVAQCLAVMPPQILYLSCNPATQARDLSLLQQSYDIVFFEVYNFFPRTPHIETLAVLQARSQFPGERWYTM
jgi:23S rRNA (uracil1939-C5)-methyltransferase